MSEEPIRWRSGIEGPDGPLTFPLTPRTHTHYCAEHDHAWTCRQVPCVRHDAIDCNDPNYRSSR